MKTESVNFQLLTKNLNPPPPLSTDIGLITTFQVSSINIAIYCFSLLLLLKMYDY